MLLITRIYGPESVGIQGAFLATLSVLAPLATLRYPQAIVIAADDVEARVVERISLLTGLVVFAALTILVIFQTENSTRLLGLEANSWLIFALPTAVFFSGYQEIITQRLVRTEKFGIMGRTSLYQALITNGGRIGTGLIHPHSGNLILVSVLNPLLWGLLAQWASWRDRREPRSTRISMKKQLSVMRKYRDFPFFRVPTDVLYAVSETIPVFFLTYFFGPAEAGFYALSRSLLIIPNRILGQSVSDVTYARMAHLNTERQPFSGLLLKSTLLLTFGPGSLIVLLTFLAQPYFSFFFGSGWEAAGPMAFWISIWMACNLGNTPAIRVANILNRQREVLYFNLIFLIIQLGILSGVILAGFDAEMLIAGYSVISAFRAIFLSVLLQFFTKVHESKW